MNQNLTSRTAVLVFALSAEAEATQKAISKADALFDVLTDHTLETVEKTGLPHFHFTEAEQTGTTFGERFTNAIRAVYEKGYSQVITIGNDSPQLKAYHILEAKKQLENKRFVLGPSLDGGFYLMGLHQEQFEPFEFQQLAWQRSRLGKQLVQLISDAVPVFYLPTLIDIDSAADVNALISSNFQIPRRILKILCSILFEPQKILGQVAILPNSISLRIPQNRGSPFLLQSE